MKTSTSLIATLAVVVVVAAFGPGLLKRVTDGHAVTVTAIWDPSPRPDGVAIRVIIGGEVKYNGVETTAPFVEGYTVRRGMRVEIYTRILGAERSFLGSSITVDGLEMINEHNPKAGPANPVVCWLVV